MPSNNFFYLHEDHPLFPGDEVAEIEPFHQVDGTEPRPASPLSLRQRFWSLLFPRQRYARLTFIGLLLVAAIALASVLVMKRGREETDNAQVEGHVVNISSRIASQVTRIAVSDNQLVNPGDVLIELDSSDVLARLQAARADLAVAQAAAMAAEAQLLLTERTASANLTQAQGGMTQATAGLGASRATTEQMEADVSAGESRRALSQRELQRTEQFWSERTVSETEMESKRAQFEQADAGLRQTRARLQSARLANDALAGAVKVAEGKMLAAEAGTHQIRAAHAAVAMANARIDQAAAAVRQGELSLSYTTIRAPVRGLVTHRVAELGQTVTPDRSLLLLVSLDDPWIVANFKESQIENMRTGQKVLARIAAFPNRRFYGRIDSIGGAAGSRFSLLPPDNSSGNFVKVVQRIPVLIHLNGPVHGELRPGMNAELTVLTGGQ